jgi:beta-galactosidase
MSDYVGVVKRPAAPKRPSGAPRATAWFLILLLAILDSGQASGQADALAEQAPAVAVSQTRSQIVLNGLWKFMPGQGPAEQAPTQDGWGLMPVPGSWGVGSWKGSLPRLAKAGQGEQWTEVEESPQAWYERDVAVPAAWKGRAVLLRIDRVSTDAVVELNGQKCGQIAWPRGEVDVTKAVKFGGGNVLRVRVMATTDADTVPNFMGTVDTQVSFQKAVLDSRGITGDVILHSRPAGAHVSDVFVQTSTREKRLTVAVELSAVKQPADVKVVAEVYGENGKLERTFTKDRVPVKPADAQSVTVDWPWADPRLWDMGQPNLYTLKLRATGRGIDDQWTQSFGFREIWREGKHLFLNGKPLRLRPTSTNGSNSGMEVLAASAIDSLREAGFNFFEFWPNDPWARGGIESRAAFLRAADKKGFLVAASLPSMTNFVIDTKTWKTVWSEENRQKFEARALADMRLFRNHPSAVMWVTTPNFFGGPNDPRSIGNGSYVKPDNRTFKPGQEGVASIKKHDPTRLVMVHHGGAVGDLYTNNMYLNLMPLQEREEWLSEYAKTGELPFMPVEFGTPLSTTMLRGRNGFGNVVKTEPWVTEFTAIYFGSEAYRTERPEYRQALADQFTSGQQYAKTKNWQNHDEIDFAPAFQKLQALFITNTWRSWRTWGVPGGMIPWSNGHGWGRGEGHDQKVQHPWVPGTLGAFWPETSVGSVRPFSEPGKRIHPAGKAMMANNSDTLAWIAGPDDRFTDKTHNYPAGAKVGKQIILINDTREVQKATYTWSASVAGDKVGGGSSSVHVQPGTTQKAAVEFTLPATIQGDKVDGQIVLTATIGQREHEDAFALRVFAAPARSAKTFNVYDPKGRTTAMLQSLGHTVRPWDGTSMDGVLIIGREALSDGGKLPGDLEAFVRGGGRAVVFNQNPKWMQDYLGWRTVPYNARRVFPLSSQHPVTAGLDEHDLRDWAGTSDLLEAYPDADLTPRAPGGGPKYGWRWGNRHMVGSAPIEKPHRSGWRPILECEFDLAYTPLMELDFDKGRLIWCGLDLEEHVNEDPAAERIGRQLLEYATDAPLTPKASKATYVGGDVGRKLLDSIGVQYAPAEAFDAASDLVILGEDTTVPDAALNDYVQNGGRMVVLPVQSELAPMAARLAKRVDLPGSLNVPDWPEAAGLSASDLRYRAASQSWLLSAGDGIEVGADGLLGRRRVGKGVVLFAQVDPDRFNAEEKTYFRFTRWRSTRALCQVLANMGATFKTDALVFHPQSRTEGTVKLAGRWSAKFVQRIADPDEQTHADPGISPEAKVMMAPDQNDGPWDRLPVPGTWERAGGNWDKANGEVVYRITVELPESAGGKDMLLSLGKIDDRDETWFNGEQVGASKGTDSEYNVDRQYAVPGRLVKAGKNVIAVRVWDSFGGGGFAGPADAMLLRPVESRMIESFYHPDYIDDFDMGDDPYRYYNW